MLSLLQLTTPAENGSSKRNGLLKKEKMQGKLVTWLVIIVLHSLAGSAKGNMALHLRLLENSNSYLGNNY